MIRTFNAQNTYSYLSKTSRDTKTVPPVPKRKKLVPIDVARKEVPVVFPVRYMSVKRSSFSNQ